MNRTLLLIICDFLLLNLLALTRWDRAEPLPTQKAPVPEVKANVTVPRSQDLVEMMKLAMENERADLAQIAIQRQQLEASLKETKAQVAVKEAETQKQRQALGTLEQEKEQVQKKATELASAVKAAEFKQDLIREQMEKELQRALAEKEAEIERQRKALTAAEQERNSAVQQVASLSAAVKVAESEKKLLRENVDHLKGEVATVRQEKEKIQAQTEKLADGVTELAVQSGELTKEVRENTPINVNMMFSDFLSNRVDVIVVATGQGLFGSSQRTRETRTVLVRDGEKAFALLHVSETPFTLAIPAYGLAKVAARVGTAEREIARAPLQFWSVDPRVVLVPVDPKKAEPAGARRVVAAKNPVKFTGAVLISRGGKYYGEVEFRLDPRTPDYVKMKKRIFSRLFGEFSPSTGDLVLSKTGEFLGVMVNSDYCAVVKSFDTQPGDTFDETITASLMRPKLEEFRARIDRLPMALW